MRMYEVMIIIFLSSCPMMKGDERSVCASAHLLTPTETSSSCFQTLIDISTACCVKAIFALWLPAEWLDTIQPREGSGYRLLS